MTGAEGAYPEGTGVIMHRTSLLLAAVCVLAACAAPRTAAAVTDEEVVKAIERAQKYLIGLQQPNGLWPEQKYYDATGEYGNSQTALFTLVYVGETLNRDYIQRGLDAVLVRPLDYTYAISMRAMALAKLHAQTSGKKRDMIREGLKTDVAWLINAQGSHGGWNYKTLNGSDKRYDLSNTQLAILALREAALAGIEIPAFVWQRSQALYFKVQQQDGSWNYGMNGNKELGDGVPGYGSMTAAGLASIFITADNLDLNSGCPCRGSVSAKARGDLERRVDLSLGWLSREFRADANPKAPHGPDWHRYYWLYAVERVGIAAGYKYFGDHNWYREGAEWLVRNQQENGSWGDIPETCFALLFLYKGRAPILFNKLEYKGEWNNHRRDIANLTAYIEKNKEQMFTWQIVSLRAPAEELHDAPVLYITAETPPEFSDADAAKLRQFTDTGGTILFEASCGNPKVRAWFQTFAKKVWPEWALKPLGPDHGVFMDPNPIKQRPEILGLDDGMRTFLFYAMDDVSCHWQTRAVASRDYLFKWGINLFTYATDKGPLRAKLASREQPASNRYNSPIRAGDKAAVRIARLRYEGAGWMTNRNYNGFERIAGELQKRANIGLKVEDGGTPAADLGDREAAYLTGSGPLALSDADRAALKQYLGKGGLLWAEAAGGSAAFDTSFQKLAADCGWQLVLIPKDQPLMTGQFTKGLGYNLTAGVQFSRALKVPRLARPLADLYGIQQDGKLVGVYSPLDIVFSATGYDAYNCHGYARDDAMAVAANLVIFLTDRAAGE